MDVLKKINKLRIDRGWSVYRLSEEAGLAQSTIVNMFNRETLPSLITLESICKAFNITMSEFFQEDISINDPEAIKEEFENAYNALSDSDRKIVLDLMRSLSSHK